VGHGGALAGAIGDRAVGLPPLNLKLARELLARTRIHRQLRGGPGQPPTDLDAVARVLMQAAQLAADCPQVKALDINPLLAGPDGVLALDARIRVGPTGAGIARFAIRPYPTELEERIPLGDGRVLWLRPIRPEDEPALQRAFAKLTPEEVRMRFFAPMRTLEHVAAARFTQIDYDREMALVLTDPGAAGRTEIYGVVSLVIGQDGTRGEYAVLVRHDMAGMGLGVLLMRRIIDYARARGLSEVVGDVLRENRTMLKLCEVLGFEQRRDPEDPNIVQVVLPLVSVPSRRG
jgi:acetyltransferase